MFGKLGRTTLQRGWRGALSANTRRMASTVVPESPASSPSDGTKDLTLPPEVLSALPPETSASWFASLSDALSPIDGIVSAVTGLHDIGLPWWSAVVVSTVALRALVFPLQIGVQRNAALMARAQPDLKLLQKEFQEAGGRTNPTATREFMEKQQEVFRRHGTSPLKSLTGPLIQAPLFLFMFFGMRRLAVNETDLVSGGILWFTDLSVSDPTLMLPVLVGGTMLASSEYVQAMQSQNNADSTAAKILRWFVRVMAVGLVPLTASMPAVVHLYWLASNSFTFAQSVLFQNPTIRAKLNIPPLPVNSKTEAAKLARAAPKIVQEAEILSQRPSKKH